MPYLKTIEKEYFKPIVNTVFSTSGELNYVLTEICKKYLKDMGERYNTYNTIIGALECCKLELYRRKISLYEDQKIKENGDVYEFE
jgi:hypothetical protein